MTENNIEATVHLLCGLPGAGKTTLAKKLAKKHDAVRFTLDEWMIGLYEYSIFDAEYGEYADRVRERIWETAVDLLRLGLDVVLDWSLWSREKRADLLAKINEVGADHTLYFLNVPLEELRRRLHERNAAHPSRAHQIPIEELERFAPYFEPPEADEGLNLVEIDWAQELPILNPQLSGDSFFWEGGPVGVLLLHGLTATTAEVRLLAQQLHEAGYTVAGPLLPGHGTRPQDLNETTWHQWAWEAEIMYQHMATICKQVWVGGESTGAVLALYLAAQHAEIAGVLCYAPAIKLGLNSQQLVRLYVAAPLLSSVPKENVGSNPYWQGYKVHPLRGVLELVRLGREVRGLLAQITQPVLVVQGRHDQTVAPEVGEIILQGVSSTMKEQYWMEQSGHVILLEDELEMIVMLTKDFMERAAAGRLES